MHYVFILNPKAGNGYAAKQRRRIESVLQKHEVSYTFVETISPGHAEELAFRYGESADVVVAIGGDGTVHEVGCGLIKGGCKAALGVLPLGTGNDYAKMLKLPKKLEPAILALIQTPVSVMADFGRLTIQENVGKKVVDFINQAGIGFEAQAAHLASRLKMIPGKTLPYLVAVLRTLRKWRFPSVKIWLDEHLYYEGRFILVDFANGFCTGGGFKLTPHALLDDGFLEVCIFEEASIPRILRVLPKTLTGEHIHLPEVHMTRTRNARVTSQIPLPVHADGEMLSLEAMVVEVEIFKNCLKVITAK
ncbi:MAG TPA: diacylglycerol kinase family lipid kinase [Rhodothermales bacterium]|nr:diacylglycerol kinase family lipid kinase [Rhodothermales bacterium]